MILKSAHCTVIQSLLFKFQRLSQHMIKKEHAKDDNFINKSLFFTRLITVMQPACHKK